MLKQTLSIIILMLFALTTYGQTVDRGPYLQKASPTQMTVKWRTTSNTQSVIQYGTSLANLNQTVSNNTSKSNHELTITGLNPNTKYYYKISNSAGTLVNASSDMYFKTHPTVGSTQSTKFWVLGDCGTANNNQRAVRDGYYNYIGNNHTDGILLLGDNAYNSGTDTEYQNAIFSNMYEDKLQNSVVWSCLGNHDGYTANSNSQTGPYYDIFSFPTAGESGGVASGTEAYYSFDYGNIHFVCLESYETNRAVGGSMYNWLQNDLQNTTQEWIVAYWHHPPYSKGSHDSDDVNGELPLVEMRQNFVPLLESYGVDLILSGHSHSYERSYFINGHYGFSNTFNSNTHTVGATGDGNGRINGDGAYIKNHTGADADKGAVYITAGASGKISGGSLNHNAMFYSVSKLGSCVIEVTGGQMDVKYIKTDGGIEDYFTINKAQNCTVGASCNDNNPCTTGDAYDSNCNCTGTFQDSDNDGVCDANDVCPNFNDALIGTTCNDNNPCTTGDVYTNNCNCAGTFQDSDNDGVCDANDTCPNDPNDNCSGVTYCAANGNNTTYEYIQKVVIKSINNTSGNEGGYADFTNLSTSAATSETVSFELTPGFPGTTYNEYWNIWIDYNQDGDFDDTGENVYSGSSYTVINGTFTVPASATTGSTGVRVAMNYSSTTPTCGSFTYGEVEDYTISITGGNNPCPDADNDGVCDADDVCPNINDNLIGNACNDNNPCTTNDVFTTNCNCAGTLQDSDNDGVCDANDVCPNFNDALIGTTCNDNDPCTTGDVYTNNCNCAGTVQDSDNDGVCDANDPCPNDANDNCGGNPTYCAASGDNATYLYIQKVVIKSINNNSGTDGGYANYTNLSTSANYGESVNLELTPGYFNTSGYTTNWKIWIDYNQDGDFDDANENVYTGNGTNIQNGSFVIPNSALTGTTTMRIAMRYSTVPLTCGSFNHGEVEDYAINIIGGTCPDADNDGVCDANDVCPNFDDALIGTPCNDGDSTTTNDVYSATCECAGTPTNATPVTVCVQITNGADDVEENSSNGTQYNNSTDIELVYDTFNSAGDQTVGLRFNNIDVPQNATIADAYLQFTADEVNTVATNLTIRGEASGNSSAFNTTAYDLSNRAKTTNSVTWNPPAWNTIGESGNNQKSPNIGAIIENIVGRSDYQQNNSMVLFITGTGERTAESYDGSPADAAELCITYLDYGANNTCNVEDSEGFETGLGIWNDGGNGCSYSTNATYSNGNRSVLLSNNLGVGSSMYTDPLNLSAYNSLNISFSFYAYSMENGDDFYLEISTDGGNAFSVVEQLVAGTDFSNYARTDLSTTINNIAFPNNTVIRFRCSASSADYVFIDDIVIEGCGANANRLDIDNTILTTKDFDLTIYPNPVANTQQVAIDINSKAYSVQLHVFDALGNLMFSDNVADSQYKGYTVPTAKLQSGIYFITIQSEHGTITKKLIVM